MSKIPIILSCLILAVPAMVPAGATEPDRTTALLNDLWTQRTGSAAPPDVAKDLAELASLMDAADSAALQRASEADDATAYGDVWALCLSETVGCSVTDASGTFDSDCETYPIHDKLWVYQTMPAVIELEATGDATGTWTSHTFHLNGGFSRATLTGTSCVVFDDSHISVVRTNGKAEFQP